MKKKVYVDIRHKLNDILGSRHKASQALHQAVLSNTEPTDVQLRMNFFWLKKFLDLAPDLPAKIPKSATEFQLKAIFIIEQVISSLLHLPSNYKKIIEDQNICSLYYDLLDLYNFFQSTNLPESLNTALSEEIITLTKGFLNLVIETPITGGLNLRKFNPKKDNHPIKFDRNTLYFQYFSYYKDLEYLEKTIELLNLSIAEMNSGSVEDNYQLLSVIAKMGENLSRRSISPRVVEFLSSDISIDILSGVRNYIFHREQDFSITLQSFISSDNGAIIIELKDIREAILNVATYLRVTVDLNRLDSIRGFYNSKYSKISFYHKAMIEDSGTLQALCPNLSKLLELPDIPENLSNFVTKMRNVVLFNNRDSLYKLIEQAKTAILKENYLKNNGKCLKKLGINGGDIIKELSKFQIDSKIDVSRLTLLTFAENDIILANIKDYIKSRESQNALLKQLCIYTEELENIILRLHPSNPNLHTKTILASEVDFDSYRLLQLPGYMRKDLSNILSDRCVEISQLSLKTLSQRYKTYSYESYSIRILGNVDEEVPEHMIGILNKLSSLDGTRNTLYYKIGESTHQIKREEDVPSEIYDSFIKLCFERLHYKRGELTSEMWKTLFDSIIKAGHIQTILVPLTHEEHQQVLGYVADRSVLKTDRFLDEACIARLNTLTVNLEERLEQYLAFLEISAEFEHDKKILLKAELLVIFIEQLHRSISEKALPEHVVKDMKVFRNYLSHNGELLDLVKHQTHEQTTLKYILQIRKQLDSKIIPSLNTHINEWYSEDQIDLLLMIYLRNQDIYYVAPQTQFEHIDLLKDNVNVAIAAARDENRVSVLPINLHHNHWVGMVVRRQEDNNIEVIYIDPMGGRLEDEQNTLRLIEEISILVPNAHIIDLGRAGFRQQSNYDDCGPFTVSNLINLAFNGRQLDNLTAEQIIELRLLEQPENGSAAHLRETYAVERNALLEPFVTDSGASIVKTIIISLDDTEIAKTSCSSAQNVPSSSSTSAPSSQPTEFFFVTSRVLDITEKVVKKKSNDDFITSHSTPSPEAIEENEFILGTESLHNIAEHHQYVSAALSNNQLSASATKVIQIIGNLVNNLEEWLDFGIAYESIDIDNQVTIILSQLEPWFDFVASGQMHVGLPPRYSGFDPDDDYNGGSGGGGGQGLIYGGGIDNEQSEHAVTFFVGQNTTSTFES